jgi:hypothetical protein
VRGCADRRRTVRRARRSWRGAALVVTLIAAPAGAQTRPELHTVHGSAAQPLPRVTGIVFAGESMLVLSGAGPALYRFPGGTRALLDPPPGAPRGFEAAGADRVLVRDVLTGILHTYGLGGKRIASRELEVLSRGSEVVGLRLAGADTVVAVRAGDDQGMALVRVDALRPDTVVSLRVPDVVRLEAPASPSYTVPRPFGPHDAWAALPDGGVVYWRAGDPTLHLVARSGVTTRWPLPPDRHAVGSADREHWLETAIPHVFMGQRPFEAIRRKARAELPFPQYFPAVLALLPDPEDGVWVQRTGPGGGELWVWVGPAGERARLRFAPGRELLAVGPRALAVRYRLREDAHLVELYDKPRR